MTSNALLAMNQPEFGSSQSTNREFMYSFEEHHQRPTQFGYNTEQAEMNPKIYSHTNVVFNKRCGDCHGTGKRWRKVGLLGLVLPKVPCNKCYKASGVCEKCKGAGLDKHGHRCKNCLSLFDI